MSQQCFDERLDATSDTTPPPPLSANSAAASSASIVQQTCKEDKKKKKNLQNVFGDGREEKKKKTNPVTVRHWMAIKSVSQAAPRTLRHAHPRPPTRGGKTREVNSQASLPSGPENK